jgi:hypothetical protein
MDPDAEPVDVADSPVEVGLEDYVGIVTVREGLQRSLDD